MAGLGKRSSWSSIRAAAGSKREPTKPSKQTFTSFRPQKATPPPKAPAPPAPQQGGGGGGGGGGGDSGGGSGGPDSSYYNRVDLANRKQAFRLGELGTQERETKHRYGIDDPTNPFSLANSLKRNYLARAKGKSVNLAAQGKLYSGTHERALAGTRRDEEEAKAELRRSYEAAMTSIGSQRAGVKFDTEEDRLNSFEAWLARAPDADVEVGEEDWGEEEGESEPQQGGGGGGAPASRKPRETNDNGARLVGPRAAPTRGASSSWSSIRAAAPRAPARVVAKQRTAITTQRARISAQRANPTPQRRAAIQQARGNITQRRAVIKRRR